MATHLMPHTCNGVGQVAGAHELMHVCHRAGSVPRWYLGRTAQSKPFTLITVQDPKPLRAHRLSSGTIPPLVHGTPVACGCAGISPL